MGEIKFGHEKENDWDVVSYSYNGIIYSRNSLGEYVSKDLKLLHPSGMIHIYSVRRKDGEVFDVGGVYYDEFRELEPIKKFFVGNHNVMYAQLDQGRGSDDGCVGINSLSKTPPKSKAKEPQPIDEFKWTDELAKDWAIFYRNTQGKSGELWGKDLMQHFKQSKLSTKQENVLLEKEWHTKPIQKENRDWEIVTFYDGCINGRIDSRCLIEKKHSWMDEKIISLGFTINSIRRLSDGEVFSIGDEVLVNSPATKGWDRVPSSMKIYCFVKNDNGSLSIGINCNEPVCGDNYKSDAYKSGFFELNQISKSQPSPLKPAVKYVSLDDVVEEAKKQISVLDYEFDKEAAWIKICFSNLDVDTIPLVDIGAAATRLLNKSGKPLFTTLDNFPVYENTDGKLYYIDEWKVVPILACNFWTKESNIGIKTEAMKRLRNGFIPYQKWFRSEDEAKYYIKVNRPLGISMKEIGSCIINYVRAGEKDYEGTAVIDWRKLDEIIKSKK